MKLGPNSKPHRGNAGYVCEMKCKLGGHIVIYDRESGFDCSADYRWIVMHEPSSLHVAVRSLGQARAVMKGVAKSTTIDEANGHAQIVPQPTSQPDVDRGDDGAEVSVRNQKRLAKQAEQNATRKAALDRFQADPDNEPSAEGKAALRTAFGLKDRP